MAEREVERLGGETGEWMERYVQRIFDLALFKTRRDQLVKTRDVSHEVDVWAETPKATVIVECKDRTEVDKGDIDQFIGKLKDLKVTRGVFAVSQIDRGQLQRYRRYLERHNVAFWDGRQLEELWETYAKLQNPLMFHRYLCQLLGIKPAYRPRGLGMMLARGLLGFAVGALLGYLSLDILPLPPLLGDQLSLLVALLAPSILIGVINARLG